MDDPKRDVTRYYVLREFLDKITSHTDTRTLTLGHWVVVLAADYDRDTQALKDEIVRLKQTPTCVKTEGGYACSHCGTSLRTDSPDYDALPRQLAEAQAEVKYLSSSINGKGGFKECLNGEQYYANTLKQQLAVATSKLAVLESDYKDLMKNYHYSHSLCSELKAKLARLGERVKELEGDTP